MLIIRFQRTGRRNSPFYRIVLQNKKDAIKSKALEILGNYNPHTKQAVFKKDEILKYLENGAQVSNSLAKLFIANNIKHDRIKFVPDAKKAPKKTEESEAKADKKEAVEEQAEAPAEETVEAPAEEKTEETPAESEANQEENKNEN